MRKAQKELARVPPEEQHRLITAIRDLAINQRPLGYKKLSGQEAYRIREGDYRAIYQIDDTAKAITVVHVGNRKDVYC